MQNRKVKLKIEIINFIHIFILLIALGDVSPLARGAGVDPRNFVLSD